MVRLDWRLATWKLHLETYDLEYIWPARETRDILGQRNLELGFRGTTLRVKA